jgi:hypothetical protein
MNSSSYPKRCSLYRERVDREQRSYNQECSERGGRWWYIYREENIAVGNIAVGNIAVGNLTVQKLEPLEKIC